MKIKNLLGYTALVLGMYGAPVNATAHHTAYKKVTVKAATINQIKKSITSHKGHVVVVNLWATWCTGCVAEFPSLVKINNKYHNAGLDIITISTDQKSDIKSKVRPFLRSQKAITTNYLVTNKEPEDIINAFDRSWQGDLPRTFIYDRNGKLVKVLIDEQSYKNFDKAVKPLIRN